MRILAVLATLCLTSQDHPQKASPFSGLRWASDEPEVEVAGTWYRLVSIDGTPAADILEFCRKAWGERDARRRFGEDLVEALVKMDRKPGRESTLEVKELEGGKVRELKGVRWTRENREALRRPPLTAEKISEDLDQLRRHLEEKYSYLALKPRDWQAELGAIQARLAKKPSRPAMALELMRFLGRFGDGHAGLEEDPLPPGCAPYLLGDAGTRLVAFQSQRRDFLDPRHPYVKSIDGRPVEQWVEAASKCVAAGSPSFVRSQAIRMLRNIAFMRGEMGLPAGGAVVLELESADRSETVSLEQTMQGTRPTYGTWPREWEKDLGPDLGYLRLEEMRDEPRFLKELVEKMAGIRDTKGLIIDVRGNGGGTRDALRTLFPYFMKPGDGLHVANVAAYRRPFDEAANKEDGYLQDRELHPITSRVWSDEDRVALSTFEKTFKPEWVPPAKDFSAWHYFALKPGGAPFTYDKPVVILMDSTCFSATDIFLGAFKGWRNVTLMGEPSGGGSGRVRQLNLANSGIRLRLSTIASFQRDGRLYDGRGVQPDVVVAPQPTDFLRDRGDSVLEAAVKRLRK